MVSTGTEVPLAASSLFKTTYSVLQHFFLYLFMDSTRSDNLTWATSIFVNIASTLHRWWNCVAQDFKFIIYNSMSPGFFFLRSGVMSHNMAKEKD